MTIDGRNFERNTIRALAGKGRPFIICGYYVAHAHRDFVTYINIRPYAPEGARTNPICNHLNVMEDDVRKYIDIDMRHNNNRDILICRAYIYQNNGILRGGISLTEELGIPPVIQANYAKAREIIESVDKSRYIDFFSFAEGRYAFYGENQWKSGHKVKKELSWKEKQELELKRKEKKRRNKPHEVSLKEFMQMYKEQNPIWIPPRRDMRGIDSRDWLFLSVPQKNLRDILKRQPALKKQVYAEFLKRC